MRLVLFVAGVLAIVGHVSRAEAQTRTSPASPLLTLGGIVNLCEGRDATSATACGAYITGFVQGSTLAQTAAVTEMVAQDVARGTIAPSDNEIDAAVAKRYKALSPFCIRATWTAEYVQAHILQYAREHPDLRSEPSADQMLKVLAKAFPCGDGK